MPYFEGLMYYRESSIETILTEFRSLGKEKMNRFALTRTKDIRSMHITKASGARCIKKPLVKLDKIAFFKVWNYRKCLDLFKEYEKE